MRSLLGRKRDAACRPQGLQIALITDPGPDPDDVKALLVCAIMHKQGQLTLRAVVANGGGQPIRRARLARCVLDHVHADDVPVGIGSAGRETAAQPHEYRLAGYTDVDDAQLHGGAELLRSVLADSADQSLTIVCISSLRDVADLMAEDPAHFVSKVRLMAIQGGLERDESQQSGWAPDSSVNNGFDMDGARATYAFCFEHGVPMTVTSRYAVPMLPMQLARSFAERAKCPVMRYLADAQFLGLEGLWQKLCAGQLPARCTKQWYFETFCGVAVAVFEEEGYEQLDESAPIVSHLNGFVKPYDVVALMTALPHTATAFSDSRAITVNGVRHLLLLQPANAPDVRFVLKLLRDTYHEVILATRQQGGVLLSPGPRPLVHSGSREGSRRALVDAGGSGGEVGKPGEVVPHTRLRARISFADDSTCLASPVSSLPPGSPLPGIVMRGGSRAAAVFRSESYEPTALEMARDSSEGEEEMSMGGTTLSARSSKEGGLSMNAAAGVAPDATNPSAAASAAASGGGGPPPSRAAVGGSSPTAATSRGDSLRSKRARVVPEPPGPPSSPTPPRRSRLFDCCIGPPPVALDAAPLAVARVAPVVTASGDSLALSLGVPRRECAVVARALLMDVVERSVAQARLSQQRVSNAALLTACVGWAATLLLWLGYLAHLAPTAGLGLAVAYYVDPAFFALYHLSVIFALYLLLPACMLALHPSDPVGLIVRLSVIGRAVFGVLAAAQLLFLAATLELGRAHAARLAGDGALVLQAVSSLLFAFSFTIAAARIHALVRQHRSHNRRLYHGLVSSVGSWLGAHSLLSLGFTIARDALGYYAADAPPARALAFADPLVGVLVAGLLHWPPCRRHLQEWLTKAVAPQSGLFSIGPAFLAPILGFGAPAKEAIDNDPEALVGLALACMRPVRLDAAVLASSALNFARRAPGHPAAISELQGVVVVARGSSSSRDSVRREGAPASPAAGAQRTSRSSSRRGSAGSLGGIATGAVAPGVGCGSGGAPSPACAQRFGGALSSSSPACGSSRFGGAGGSEGDGSCSGGVEGGRWRQMLRARGPPGLSKDVSEDSIGGGASAAAVQERERALQLLEQLRARAAAGDGLAAVQLARAEVELSSHDGLPSADYYVVHSWGDDPAQKLDALRARAAAFTAEHGRAPVVWVDALCASPALRPAEELAHVPVRLGRCRQLLVLWGPTLVERLWCVLELVVWRALGGSLDDVVVVPIGSAPLRSRRVSEASNGSGGGGGGGGVGGINRARFASGTPALLRPRISSKLSRSSREITPVPAGPDYGALIASVDTFAVMYSQAALAHIEGSIVQAFELATVSRVNEAVREYLPKLITAVKAVTEVQGPRASPTSRATSSRGSAGSPGIRRQRLSAASKSASLLAQAAKVERAKVVTG